MMHVKTLISRFSTTQAVLFDLDGTIVDTLPHILASFRHATADVLGAPLPDDELMRYVGIPLAEQMRHFTGDADTADRLLASYREFDHRTHDEMVRLYPNTAATLRTLTGADLPLGIVTSKSRQMAHRAIALFELGRYFGAVVTEDDTPVHKPDPLPVLTGACLLGVDPERTIYVGDSPMDIKAGKAAGAATIAATWGVASRDRLEAAGPDAVIDDISELAVLLGIED